MDPVIFHRVLVGATYLLLALYTVVVMVFIVNHALLRHKEQRLYAEGNLFWRQEKEPIFLKVIILILMTLALRMIS